MKPSSNLTNIGLIVRREYLARVRTRVFAVATIGAALLALVATFLPTIVALLTQGEAQTQVVVVDQVPGRVAGQDPAGLVRYLEGTLNATSRGGLAGTAAVPAKPPFAVTAGDPSALPSLRTQVQDHKLDSLLVVGRAPDGDAAFEYVTKRNPDSASVAQMQQALNFVAAADRLERAGLSAAQQQQAFSPARLVLTSTSSNTFNNGKSDAENGARYGLTLALVVLNFTMITLYGNWVAGGVVEEKSSRVMEIMINAATPTQLMAGKILGVGAAALTQMVALVVAGIVGVQVQGPVQKVLLGSSSGPPLDLASASVSLLLLGLLFFLLGFGLYSALYAGLGSLVSRPEDVNQAVGPIQFLLIPGYILGIAALPAINETWVQVLSFVPLFTPILMVARLGVGHVEPIEVLSAIALMLVSIVVMTLLAARLYRNGVLHYGQRLGILRVLRQRPGDSPGR